MADSIIELRKVDPVTVMTLSAGKANVLDATLLDAITRTIDQVIADGARVLVVTGDGASFSGGLALPTLIDQDRAAVRALMSSLRVAMQRVLEAPIPVIAGINGNAIAGGCVLALMCDVRLMIEHTERGTPRIGLNEAQLGLGLPPVVLEAARAKLPVDSHVPVMLEGLLFEPAAALAMKLVDEVVPGDQFEARVLERGEALATMAPLAYAQIKRALVRPIVEAIERTDTLETDPWLDTWFSPEGQRRMRAAVARITKK
ncbi:MAG: enoyl-CoA hydratase/isomerase family protein [Deltaproteobacteria bacterium]|nr:enoyl-CoA hydratase/isomerase family protein [Deltaproteobacteria bacterium]